MSKDGLLSILNTAKQIKNERKSLFKSKRNKSRKSLYKPTGKSLFKSKMEEFKKILHELQRKEHRKNPFNSKKYYDNNNDSINYKRSSDTRTLFESNEKYHYKPIRTGNVFSSNGNGDKDKSLSTEEYLSEIRPYLSDT